MGENGAVGEGRDGADIDTGDAAGGVDAGDTDAVGAEVAEEGGGVVDGVDADVADIAAVPEPNRDADEEGAGEHEGVSGGGGAPHKAQPAGRLAAHH